MELAHLRYVVKLAETTNYSKAADALFITQPALSQQIRILESEVGLKLFERTTRKVLLTPAGEEFVSHAKIILNEIDKLTQAMETRQRSMQNTLSVGLLSTLSHLHIPAMIQGFQRQNPNIQIKLHIAWSADLIARLKLGELDAAITSIYFPEGTKPDSKLNIQVFLEDVIVVICSRQCAICDREFVTMEDIRGLPVVALDEQTSIQMQMNDIFSHYPDPPKIICTCPNMDSLFSIVEANVGIGFLSSGVAHTYAGANLMTVPFHPVHHTQNAIITKQTQKPPYALRLFEDYLKGTIH